MNYLENRINRGKLGFNNSEADHIAKLTGQKPKDAKKASATVSAADMKQMREEK
jgi:hypothetical protein